MHGLIHSHLDFCNSLFVEQPAYLIDRFQKIQNRAARIITKSCFDHPSKPLLMNLHWLPIKYRVQYKILSQVFQCLYETAPAYLKELICIETPSYTLRHNQGAIVRVPRCRTKKAERAFSFAGPKLWNALPRKLRQCSSGSIFRRELKTHLFQIAYAD